LYWSRGHSYKLSDKSLNWQVVKQVLKGLTIRQNCKKLAATHWVCDILLITSIIGRFTLSSIASTQDTDRHLSATAFPRNTPISLEAYGISNSKSFRDSSKDLNPFTKCSSIRIVWLERFVKNFDISSLSWSVRSKVMITPSSITLDNELLSFSSLIAVVALVASALFVNSFKISVIRCSKSSSGWGSALDPRFSIGFFFSFSLALKVSFCHPSP